VEVHLDSCPSCRKRVSLLAQMVSRSLYEGPTADPDLPTLDSADATAGCYILLRRLGAGAMGVVYDAYDPELRRRVALKLLRPHTRAPGAQAGTGGAPPLLREAQALAQVQHPNVIAVYDVG